MKCKNKEKQIEEITQKAVRKNENKKCNFADLLNQEIEELKKANAIEEMAKIMCGNDCEECAKESANFYGQTVEEARNNKCLLKNCAKTLYNAGYRKIDKDSVLIPEKITEETSAETLIKIAKYNEKVRKGMAKEILQAVKQVLNYLDDEWEISNALYPIEKQYGVEVEEND